MTSTEKSVYDSEDERAKILGEIKDLKKSLMRANTRLKQLSARKELKKMFPERPQPINTDCQEIRREDDANGDNGGSSDDELAGRSSGQRQTLSSMSEVSQNQGQSGLPLSLLERQLSSYPCSQFHFLLLLSDSALPLGSFAFSSGLESYVSHQQHCNAIKTIPPDQAAPGPKDHLLRFIPLTLASISTTTLPYVISSWRNCSIDVSHLIYLDDVFDASISCPVVRRSSIFQGKALLNVWEKSFVRKSNNASTNYDSCAIKSKKSHKAITSILSSLTLYKSSIRTTPPISQGHFPITWGAICRFLGIPLDQTCYIYLLNHLKTILSAAVRQNLIGPYASQMILASSQSMEYLKRSLQVGMKLSIDEAGQTIPTLDLYQGRHELLYSRVFNS